MLKSAAACLYFALLSLSAMQIAEAAAPLTTAELELATRVHTARISQDGRRLFLLSQPEKSSPGGVQILEITESWRPITRAVLPLNKKVISMEISADGKRILLISPMDQANHDKATIHEVSEFDVSVMEAPNLISRREVMGKDFVSAEDASSYAFSYPEDVAEKNRSRQWVTIVRWVSGNKRDVRIVERDSIPTNRVLASNGRYLVGGPAYMLAAHKMTASASVSFEQDYSSIGRYTCPPKMTPTGFLLAVNQIHRSIDTLAMEKGLPRISRQFVGDESACFVTSGDKNGYYLSTNEGKLLRIKADLNGKTSVDGEWWFPLRMSIVAATENLAIGLKTSGKTLRVFRLDKATKSPDWGVLDRAHQEILAAYQKAQGANNPSADWDAYDRFIDAEILAALEHEAPTIANKRAAQIMNDFGFIASRTPSVTLAERAYRQTLKFDPNRSVAHLNLAELLRKNIPSYSSYAERERVTAEAQGHYRRYLTLSGKSSEKFDSFLRTDLQSPDGNHCKTIANYTNAARLEELLWPSGINIPLNNGRKVDVAFEEQGTAHAPVMDIYDALTGRPEKGALPGGSSVMSDELWGGDHLGLILYKDEAFVLHYRDKAHPVAADSLTGGKSCRFSVETKEYIGPNATEHDLCVEVQQSRKFSQISFSGYAPMSTETVQERYGETIQTGTKWIDLGNDGAPIHIGIFNMTSGAGAGCDVTFFDEINRRGTGFNNGLKRELLMAMQRADSKARYPVLPCKNNPQWFRYKNRVYFETQPDVWPPSDSWNAYHRVTRVNRGRVIEVCDFRFETTVSADD